MLNRFWADFPTLRRDGPECSKIVTADSARSRRCQRPSTDIAPEFYRSNRGSFPATRTTDIPEREQSRETRKQLSPMQQPQEVKVEPFECQSGAAETAGRNYIGYDFVACFLSRMTKRIA